MTSPSQRGSQRRSDRLITSPWTLAGLVVIGAALRVAVARQDLYADELATYWVSTKHDFIGVIETVASIAEITPPLHFLLTWLTTRLGDAPELVRLPSLIAGVATIPLVFAVGVRTVGHRAALLAATFTTLSSFMIFYSTEARGYGLLMALVLLSTWALLRAVEGSGWTWWIVYGAAVCLAAYTHYTGAFVLGAQLAWALWVHPRSRARLLVATGAAVVLYLPWLPSLRGDLDSPTVPILEAFSPFNAEAVREELAHWSVGFPFALPRTSLFDLPGRVPILMLIASVLIGAVSVVTRRGGEDDGGGTAPGTAPRTAAGVALVTVLALATPVGAALQSAVSTDVFVMRSLAASWPYLALATAALISASRPPWRMVASGLAVVALAIGAVTMLTPDFERPAYSELADFADDHDGAVIVNGAAFAAGPLTNFEVESSKPDAPVFRLNVPEQMEEPFSLRDHLTDPADIAARAVAAADGGPIIVLSGVPPSELVETFVDLLPSGYRATEVKQMGGLFDTQAVVYELEAEG